MRLYLLGLATLPALLLVLWIGVLIAALFYRARAWEDCWCAPGEPSGEAKYPGGTSVIGRWVRWRLHRQTLRHRAWRRSNVWSARQMRGDTARQISP